MYFVPAFLGLGIWGWRTTGSVFPPFSLCLHYLCLWFTANKASAILFIPFRNSVCKNLQFVVNGWKEGWVGLPDYLLPDRSTTRSQLGKQLSHLQKGKMISHSQRRIWGGIWWPNWQQPLKKFRREGRRPVLPRKMGWRAEASSTREDSRRWRESDWWVGHLLKEAARASALEAETKMASQGQTHLVINWKQLEAWERYIASYQFFFLS